MTFLESAIQLHAQPPASGPGRLLAPRQEVAFGRAGAARRRDDSPLFTWCNHPSFHPSLSSPPPCSLPGLLVHALACDCVCMDRAGAGSSRDARSLPVLCECPPTPRRRPRHPSACSCPHSPSRRAARRGSGSQARPVIWVSFSLGLVDLFRGCWLRPGGRVVALG